jgi:hypothetical protein
MSVQTPHMLHISYSLQVDNGSILGGGTEVLVSIGLPASEYATAHFEWMSFMAEVSYLTSTGCQMYHCATVVPSVSSSCTCIFPLPILQDVHKNMKHVVCLMCSFVKH